MYSYDEGVGAPLRRSGTFGPQFVERALTTGRGTTSFGLNVFHATYDTISGYRLDDLPVAVAGDAPETEFAAHDLACEIPEGLRLVPR